MKILLNGRGGKVGSVLGPALETAGHSLVVVLTEADAMVDFTRPDAVVVKHARGPRAGVPVVVGTSSWDHGSVDFAASKPAAGLLRAELRHRRRADDALRGRGVAVFSRRPRSSSSTT